MATYRIKIMNGNDCFEVEGDKKFVLDFWKEYQGKSKAPKLKLGHTDSTPSSKTGTKDVSVGEFIRSLNVKKHTDIVLAFGYFLESFSGLKEFAPADINTCYYDSKLEASNTSQMIIQNIKRGYMMPSKKEGDKRYLLTQTGMDFIQKLASK